MRTGVPEEVNSGNDEGTAPVSPPPASVSVGAPPPLASVSNSACMSYTAALARLQDKTSVPDLDFAHSIIGRVVEFQWLMWLNEARTDIPIHLMSPNPGPGHGGMSCASPSKPTFSMAWRHNRNAKNAQSRAQTIQPNRSLLCTPKY